jgi:plasmid stabilization system protein ParE
MDRTVNWTLAALADLEAAGDYIARDSPHYAASLITEILAAGRSLAVLSERGRHVPELTDPHLRELIVSPYRLIYRVEGDGVWILALIHARRDFGTAWRKRDSLGSN